MPKRSCPFGEAAPLQLKTRVGLRELSRGVRGEEYRREVFDVKEHCDGRAKSRTVNPHLEIFAGALNGSSTWGMVLVVEKSMLVQNLSGFVDLQKSSLDFISGLAGDSGEGLEAKKGQQFREQTFRQGQAVQTRDTDPFFPFPSLHKT
ncbi:hypothetical protein WISP_132429 [Willisornis vidua]|uniref:Uncharacterized protein n=1 Tax=Willisornis vidua TaxID=1566151 RepID=A0ABQ9CSC1_9PASS|nr:hypothetical protein WISP_132429 [Willisornis vidua]